MAKKPIQFQVPEKFRQEIEQWVQDKELTLSEFLRQSVRLCMILRNYIDQGYTLVLRKEDGTSEKEILMP
jgi:Arc/MetJ-type ribon-helix-helix transcriptional regulator